jgi:AraC family transcriptional activator of tynA and feaB
MHAVQVFSTQGVPAPRKVEMWNTMLGGLADAVQVQPRDPWHFDGTLIRQRVGPLTLFEVRCASVSVRHQRTLAARNSHPTFQVLMPLESEFTLTHSGGPAVTVGDGSSCLIDRTAPYEMVHGHGLRTIGVEFPHAMLEGFLPQAKEHGGAVADRQSSAGRVLGGLLRTLGSELTSGGAADSLPPMIASCIAGFVAAAFRNPAEPQPGRGSRSRLAAYREYVESRLGDGDLRPVDVARHFGVSERYVRLIFQSSGEPLSAYLLRIRLARAAQLLRNDYYAQHTITGIAHECGFNNASHFGQCFRERYGKAPRDFRGASGLQIRHS